MLHWFGNAEELSSHIVKSGFTVRSLGMKALSALAVAAVVAVSGQAALATTTTTTTSDNWSGYALTSANNSNNTFSNVSANFVVPTVTPSTTTGLSEAAFWVGLDGYSSQRIEQIGVIAEAETGYTSYYYAFYAMGSGSAVSIAQVLPGDNISVAVSYDSSTDKYGLYIDDTSRPGINETLTPSAGTNPAPSSAEWIAEANGILGTPPYPLANFGSVTFTNASATDSGPTTGTLNAFSSTKINLVPTSGLSANTGPLSTDGSSFTVTTAVPEPAALGLMSVGGLTILFGRRKRH